MSQQKIKQHYEIALNLIKIGKTTKAEHELFNKMPSELYDESLDIMDNRNLKVKDPGLKALIREVHESLSPIDEEEKDSDINDDDLTVF